MNVFRLFNFIKLGLYYKINLYSAFITYKILKFLKIDIFGKHWMIGGAGGNYYDDNEAALHGYILKHQKHINIYCVTNKNSPDLNKIPNRNKILYLYSFKADLYSFFAETIIFTHSIRDVIRISKKHLNPETKTIYISHGVEAFEKKVGNEGKIIGQYDFIIATSDFEKAIKSKWGIEREKIFITGLPRYDRLFLSKNSKDTKGRPLNIFLMPTWRRWLDRKWFAPSKKDIQNFFNSDYFRNIIDLSRSEEMISFLERTDSTIRVFIHPNMHKYLWCFRADLHPNIQFLELNANIQEEIVSNDVLITDYSSVFFDFTYLKKPVISYQTDPDKFDKINRNAFIDEFAFMANTSDQVIKHLIDFYEKGFYFDKEDSGRINKFVKYDDKNNSKRVFDHIINLSCKEQ